MISNPVTILRRLTGITLAVLLLAGAAWAENDTDLPDLSQPLTLDDCIQIGLRNASEIVRARLAVRSQELAVSDARAAYLPKLSTDGRFFANDQVDFGFERQNVDLNVAADYLLWDQGRRKIALDQAKSNEGVLQTRLTRTQQDLVFNIVKAYYELLKAKRLVDLDREILSLSKANADRVRAFLEAEAGTVIPADLAAAEVRTATDELSLVRDENALEIARANLPTVLGLDPSTTLDVVEDQEFENYTETGKFGQYTKTLDETVAIALRSRPEVKESQLNVRVLELSRRLAALQRYPQVTASGTYAVNLDDYLHERENFKRFRSWNASVVVTFPLFDGGVTRRQVERADIELKRAQESHEALERAIALEARQAYLNLKQAEKRLEISAVQVRNARINLDATNGRFEQELAIPLELFDAQTQFAQASTNRIRVYYDYKIAQHALQRAIGKDIP